MGIHDKALIFVLRRILTAQIKLEDGTFITPDKGTPQGGIISPLLANIVLNELDHWVESQWQWSPICKRNVRPENGYRQAKKSNLKEMFIVRYADDFRIYCRTKDTNGLLIDKENIETLKKCVDYFEISLDGVDESSCSKIRGEGVFEKVVETVHFLKENGCGEISLSMVICDKNQDLEEEFKKLNIKLGTHPIVRVLSFVGRGKEKRDELSLMSQGEVYIPDKFFDTERPYVFWGNCLEKNRKRMIRANGDIYTCPLIIDEELKENNILRVSDLSEVENGKLYNLKEKLLSQNPKCRTCKVNPFCWNCIATIKENTENGAMDDYCSKVKAFYFNTVWGE